MYHGLLQQGGMMMNVRTWTASCAAIACTAVAGVFAQAPATSESPQSTTAKTITVSGCVQRAPEATTGTSGATTPSTSGAATKFVLTNAMLSTSGTAGTSGTAAPSTTTASEYRLDTEEAKLTPHVGHKVEVTGKVDPASSSEAKPASASSAPTLKVDSVKMVSSTCP